MNKSMAARLDRAREQDERRERDVVFNCSRRTKESGEKMTIQRATNAVEHFSQLNRALATCRALLRGEPICVGIGPGIMLDRFGKEYRNLRAVCLRTAAENLNYWHSLASQRVELGDLEREVQSVRLAISESLDNGE